MADDITTLHYDRMVEEALRGVMTRALTITASQGLPGEHHFYITFRTRFPGVVLPDYLLEKHPDEMTILLQHQFWGLEVSEIAFEVTLSFNKVNERLRVPFAAVTGFADPSCKFGLQFEADRSRERPALLDTLAEEDWEDVALKEIEKLAEKAGLSKTEYHDPAETTAEKPVPDGKNANAAKPDQSGNVVTLDAFRKKGS